MNTASTPLKSGTLTLTFRGTEPIGPSIQTVLYNLSLIYNLKVRYGQTGEGNPSATFSGPVNALTTLATALKTLTGGAVSLEVAG